MPEEALGGLVQAFDASSKAATENIVLDFGIDRFLQTLSTYGSILIAAFFLFASLTSPPISCINNPGEFTSDITRTRRSTPNINSALASSQNQLSRQTTTALKQHLDYFCWETDDDLIDFEGKPFDLDPRDIMGDLIFFIALQIHSC